MEGRISASMHNSSDEPAFVFPRLALWKHTEFASTNYTVSKL